MANPIKPVYKKTTNDDWVRLVVGEYMFVAMAMICKELKISGASANLLVLTNILDEMYQLDQGATSQMLLQLSKLYDPKSNNTQKQHADRRRLTAVKRIFAAVDLTTADTEGVV